ncbi:MAG: tRNA epoxyqueuosine(34) reductase QueG [Armatimonadetes bacterium]|nr:tRNA epoxyqueuosine(34) reductase QueG [Armatimonadota bacterium]
MSFDIPAEQVKELCRQHGADLVGITDGSPPASWPHLREWVEAGRHGSMRYMADALELRRSLESVLPGTQSVICIGVNYHQPVERESGQAKVAQYALGRDYHKVLRQMLKRVQKELEQEYYGFDWRVGVDSAPIMERDLAHRAGLGWFGKNTMLINSQRGSYFLLAELLTTARIEPDEPAIGGCGTCRACIEACPTGAIIFDQNRWQVDARRCISYLSIEHKGEIDPELQSLIGDWTFGCDVCQEVCPFNQARESQPLRAQPTQNADFLARRDFGSLENLLEQSEEEWDTTTQGSPVRRAGFDGLKRNARINLTNKNSPDQKSRE